MYVVSVLGFAGLHMTSASSPFEVGPYLIMAAGICCGISLKWSKFDDDYPSYDK